MNPNEVLFPDFPHFLHGGDYNPDQWPEEVWDEDMRLMREAHCNTATVGVFSWAQLEPEEGVFRFEWLDRIMDMLAHNGCKAILATPTAAQPPWMSRKYPEVLRTGVDGRRFHHSARVLYCLSSPIYREKVRGMNERLARRYGNHPALLLWHISNEYNSYCHCDRCRAGFVEWVREKYGSLDALNEQWYTAFWGHTLSDWAEVQIPHALGEQPGQRSFCHAMHLDWKRYMTQLTVDFLRNEREPLREITPEVPVTTNLMGFYEALDYWKLAREIDIVSWDSYPEPSNREDMWRELAKTAMEHDLNRCLGGGKPFLLMESSPDSVNWRSYMKLKRPGIHKLMSLQAVAHGSDSVQYFQWRKGRGGGEKFHGAVVDHSGRTDTRVFQDVREVGQALEKMEPVLGSRTPAEVALVVDWENRWAIDIIQGPVRPEKRRYIETCLEHYLPFWKRGVAVDVVDQGAELTGYKLVVAPMPYMLKPGFAQRLERFVESGGQLVTTYWCGMVNENDLCFLGGFPGPLRKLLGIWIEETDILYDEERVVVTAESGNALGLDGEWRAETFCGLPHAEGAEVLARYAGEFYAGRPAITANDFGKGKAYHLAFRCDASLHDSLYEKLIQAAGLRTVLPELPEGVSAQARRHGEEEFVFLMNCTKEARKVSLDGKGYRDLLEDKPLEDSVKMAGYGLRVLRRPAGD